MQFKKITAVILASLCLSSPLMAHAKPAQVAKVQGAKTSVLAKSAKKQTLATKVKKARKVKAHVHHKKTKRAVMTQGRYGVKKSHAPQKTVVGQYHVTGVASYYGGKFNGRRTASGEIFNEKKYTAAHRTLPMGSYVSVTNLSNGRNVVVRINDRGPFSHNRILDVSKGAAEALGMVRAGLAKVEVVLLSADKAKAQSVGKTSKGLSVKNDKTHMEAHNPNNGVLAAVNGIYRLKMVQIKTEKEARQFARAIKQKTDIVPNGKGYDLVVQLASEAESKQVKHQLSRLSHYQIFSYSQK